MGSDFLLIVAHPDDETLGASHLLQREPRHGHVLHTTDGAPREPRFWQQANAQSREDYAAARRAELQAAMGELGFPAAHLHALPFADREAVQHLPALAREIRRYLEAFMPAAVYTHAFEGGHPDHDATALAVHAACASLRQEGCSAPGICEFPGYHARNGEFFAGEFVRGGNTARAAELTHAERERKQRALKKFVSQQRVIQRFDQPDEAWREAEAYDFRRRPHKGPLYYEIREMGVRFEEFARLAEDAFPELFGGG